MVDDDNDDDVMVDDGVNVDEFQLKLKTFNAKIKSLYGKKVELVVRNAKKNNEKIIWEVPQKLWIIGPKLTLESDLRQYWTALKTQMSPWQTCSFTCSLKMDNGGNG
jgi:hypothetical protein